MTVDKLNSEIRQSFTKEELDVLTSVIDLEYNQTTKQWSVMYGQPYIFWVETQLGITKYKARKLVMKYLRILDHYDFRTVNDWLENDMYEHNKEMWEKGE